MPVRAHPLLALALPFCAAAAAQDLQARVQEALARARQPLLDHLQSATAARHPGLLALLCLAALHDGVGPDDRVFAAALRALADCQPQQTYDLALRLLVLEGAPSFPDRVAVARADYERLLQHRHDGAFGYTADGGHWDLSNTQYAALGLRAAAAIGIEVERKVWIALADEIMAAQRSDGGFAYASGRNAREATPSMTVAGIGVLAICRQGLARLGRSLPEIDRRLARAWKWMDQNAAAIGDPSVTWSYYFHYGLERAAILCDVGKVGGRDWYEKGAQMLVLAQREGGGWISEADRGPGQRLGGGRGEPVATAFAVLFLRRKFQKVATPITPARAPTLDQLTEQSSAVEIQQTADGLVRRGRTALADVLLALRDEVAPRRQAALLALREIAGQDFGIDPERTAAQNADALKRAELWYLKNR